MGKLQHILEYGKTYGIKEMLNKSSEFLTGKRVTYEKWYQLHRATPQELERQQRETWKEEPLVSIIVPAYQTPALFFRQMADSVIAQSYGNWELCVADGSQVSELEEIVRREYPKEKRIRYSLLKQNLGISGNTNEALKMASGDIIALLDHDDVLAPDALYHVVKAYEADGETGVVYTDEDKVDMELATHYQPHFKPDFNLDYLRTNNYICHFFTVRRAVAEAAGGFRSEFDGAQDFDFILRCTEQAGKIVHIPRILYHWRMHPGSVAENPESKQYAYEAGRQAVESQLERLQIQGSVEHAGHWGLYRTHYELVGTPLVSIVVSSGNNGKKAAECRANIQKHTSYPNYELLSLGEPVKGEYLVFVSEDIRVLNDNWLEELLSNCQRKEVGAAGGKIYYKDQTVYSAGILLGVKGLGAHAFAGTPKNELGYYARAAMQQNVSAVTTEFMIVKKEVYDRVSQSQNYLFADRGLANLDFCLRVRKAGYLLVFTPMAEAYTELSPEKNRGKVVEEKACNPKEADKFCEIWREELRMGDPCYNPNLTKSRCDYSLG